MGVKRSRVKVQGAFASVTRQRKLSHSEKLTTARMNGWFIATLCLFLACIVTNPARAQSENAFDEIFERGCGDDQGVDRCDEEIQAGMRDLYSWESAQSLTEAGITFRRMMFVDGYGNDVVAITFFRKPGQSPRVEVVTPRGEKERMHAELSATVGGKDWDNIISRSKLFDQKLAREVEKDNEEAGIITLCLHGWFVVAEAGDAAMMEPNLVGQRKMPAKIRSDAEGACAKGLTVPFAFEMADLALKLLPECQSFPTERVRNTPQLLAYCHKLGGDRLAASDAMGIVSKLEAYTRRGSNDQPRWMLAQSARAGMPSFTDMLKLGELYLGFPFARDIDHASVDGVLVKSNDNNDNGELIADIKFELVRQAGRFVVLSFDISDFREME